MIELTDGHERGVWDAAFRAHIEKWPATPKRAAVMADQAVRVWRTRMRPTPTADGGPTPEDMWGEVDHGG